MLSASFTSLLLPGIEACGIVPVLVGFFLGVVGVQNVPEGLAVSVAARNAGFGSLFYAGIAGVRAGVVEIPIAVLGAVAVGFAAPVLPYAMGFTAGGMLFVISHEIVPQTHSRGNEHVATMGMMVGAAVMLTLDVTLA
jgi:ZIP family zinc transporter